MSVAMMNAFRAGTPEGKQRFKYLADLATAFMGLTVRDFVRLVPDHGASIDEGNVGHYSDLGRNAEKLGDPQLVREIERDHMFLTSS